MPKSVQILIADDSAPVRASLRFLLESIDGWEVCAALENGAEAVVAAAKVNPNVVVLDFLMPEMDGLSAAREITRALPSAPIVLYTMVAVPELEREASKFGVRRVISKSETHKLVPAIKELLAASCAETGPLPLASRETPAVSSPQKPSASASCDDSA